MLRCVQNFLAPCVGYTYIYIYMDILGYIGMYMMYWDVTRYCDGCECLEHLVMDFDSF